MSIEPAKPASEPNAPTTRPTDVFLFSVHFILRATFTVIAERLASVTADTGFKVFGLTRQRTEPSLPASKANALNH